ncbi:TPA: plasmid SOS inhibition protein A [Escherichia coli]|uniref:plasmid SOS inhibition protein A n=1 Tax=Escherichia coli TaxID=562 RepID=UPI000BE19CBA|nr:plasmid SOS inhibition protein A [Escherichia coli]EDT9866677.1 plasmid SOS inhibition protein A [Salmonella enterica]HAL5940011.1 plasmid SOS inhibition protein A [Escherichia coli]
MIPANMSLVPQSHERRAAMQAIAEVEAKYERGTHIAEYPYARTFFRILNGSKHVTVQDIGWFCPGLTAQDLRGKKQDWLAAIDRLIESRGACCWLPLSVSDGWRLFPETKFQMSERRRRQNELSAEKYTRQRRKEACQRESAYQALAGQAEIDLAFHTPETVSSWSARWSGTELRQYDLEDMFWRWSERFPSLEPMERWMMANQPFWSVMVESDALAKESPESVRQLERWMVPNKLMHQEAS